MKTATDLKIPFTWEERVPILLDRFFYIPGHYDHVPKIFPFGIEQKPVVIEYCSGNGEWIGKRAKENVQVHWMAVEKRFERARLIWLKMHREEISNLTVVCGEAALFTRYYAPQAAEIYINFPDPWPKRRHAKHRLISAPFLHELSSIVPSGGRATCVTDHAGYAKEMGEEFGKCPHWKPLFHVNEWPDYGSSFFKALWTQQQKLIHYLCYERL